MSKLVSIKNVNRRHFVQIPNKLFEDPNLSAKAKGVMGYLLSRPDEWEFHINDLNNKFADGKDGLYSAIKELVEQKYALWLQQRMQDGRINRRQLLITDEKNLFPIEMLQGWTIVDYSKNKPDREKPDVAKPDAYKDLTINKTEFNTCSEEQVKHFDSQSADSVSLKSTLIRKGMAKAKAKAKEIPIDKPMNGPYKKIFNYWQLSGLPSPKTNTKIYEKNVVALRRLFKSFSIDQIIQTIDRLKLALSPDYSPASLKSKEYYSKLYFSEFVFNERTGESIFNKLLETPPVPLKNSVAPVPDPDPNITTYIKTFYLEKILGNANVQLTVSDENVFRITTQKLIKFHIDNQGKYPTPWFGVGDVARLYTDAITDYLDRFKNGNVRQWGINSFKWDDFFNKHLPAYMFDQAMLVKPSFKSPLNM